MAGNTFPISLHSTLIEKVRNFSDNVYDFNEGDNLTTLMTILLGDSGTGQLNNIQTIARLSQVNIEYSNLDEIMGLILQVQRESSEIYSFVANPFIDQLTDSQWQEISVKDASYRERLLSAAEAFQNGAIIWALLTLCEAMTSIKFYITESWRTPGFGRDAINNGQEIVLIPLIDNASIFTWNQSKAYFILNIINRIIPNNFIISFATPQQVLTNIPMNYVGSSSYSEYFHMQPAVTAANISTPAVIQPGSNSRYWLKNNVSVIAPYFSHLQTQEIIIDITGNISSVTSADTSGTNAPSDSLAFPSVRINSTIYGAQ